MSKWIEVKDECELCWLPPIHWHPVTEDGKIYSDMVSMLNPHTTMIRIEVEKKGE